MRRTESGAGVPERGSTALAGYAASSAACVVLALLGSWGSPEWFSSIPLGYAYDFMDALGAYALSCAAYFSIRYFLATRRPRPGSAASAGLFALCFIPVVAHSLMVLTGVGRGGIDLWKRLCALAAWSAMAAAALPSALRPEEGSSGALASVVARGTVAAWLLVSLSFAMSFLVELPGIVPPALYTLLLAACSLLAYLRPRRAADAESRPAVQAAAGAQAVGDCAPPGAFESFGISEREREVVRLLLEGRTNREIAEGLFISLSTVKSHIANVFAKTGARNRVEVARLFGRGAPPKV